MRAMLYVDSAGFSSEERLAGWIEYALAFVRTLPPK
jgi:hypothetical protein